MGPNIFGMVTHRFRQKYERCNTKTNASGKCVDNIIISTVCCAIQIDLLHRNGKTKFNP